MSTSDRLNQIEARADAATEGPWWGSMLGSHVEIFAGAGTGSDPMLATELRPGDAEFIASVRTDVPALVAAVRAVLAYVDYCDDEGWSAWPDDIRRAIATALGEGE